MNYYSEKVYYIIKQENRVNLSKKVAGYFVESLAF
jgi:hypothetical protein